MITKKQKAMIATTAKLEALLSVTGGEPWDLRSPDGGVIEVWIPMGPLVASVHFLRNGKQISNAALIANAPALARLVLTLETALRGYACSCGGGRLCHVHMEAEEFDRMFQQWNSEWHITNVGGMRKALAAVEELEL